MQCYSTFTDSILEAQKQSDIVDSLSNLQQSLKIETTYLF